MPKEGFEFGCDKAALVRRLRDLTVKVAAGEAIVHKVETRHATIDDDFARRTLSIEFTEAVE